MDNKWRAIWNRRKPGTGKLSGNWEDIFLELKRLNGYDVMGEGISLDAFLDEYAQTKELLRLTNDSSVFEVGCGTGANLYLMQRDGMTVGGTDYAEGLIETARTVISSPVELYAGEADAFDTTIKYDAALSNSVFSYFPDEAFAARVLTRMLKKTAGAIGLIDIHDADKEEEFLTYRRAAIPDYDERYKGLGKLFYRRSFFEDFARAHDLRIEFPAIEMEGYWNTPFVFHVFLYRK